MNNVGHMITAIVAGIIGLAAISIVFSSNANTTNVVGTAFSGLSGIITAATGPISNSGQVL